MHDTYEIQTAFQKAQDTILNHDKFKEALIISELPKELKESINFEKLRLNKRFSTNILHSKPKLKKHTDNSSVHRNSLPGHLPIINSRQINQNNEYQDSHRPKPSIRFYSNKNLSMVQKFNARSSFRSPTVITSKGIDNKSLNHMDSSLKNPLSKLGEEEEISHDLNLTPQLKIDKSKAFSNFIEKLEKKNNELYPDNKNKGLNNSNNKIVSFVSRNNQVKNTTSFQKKITLSMNMKNSFLSKLDSKFENIENELKNSSNKIKKLSLKYNPDKKYVNGANEDEAYFREENKNFQKEIFIYHKETKKEKKDYFSIVKDKSKYLNIPQDDTILKFSKVIAKKFQK